MNRQTLTQRIAGCGLLIVLLCWSSLGSPASSATKPATKPPPAQTQTTPAGPQVFGVTEVIPRSERALDRLREIRQKLDSDTSVSVVETALPTWAQQSDEWWKMERRILGDGGSVQRVNDLLHEWSIREAQLNSWKLLLADSSKAWVEEGQTLDRIIANWQATLSALKADAPPAVRDKAAEVLRESDALRRVLQDKIARLVAAQVKLAEQSEVLNKMREQLGAIRIQSGRGLLSLDSSPLWNAISDTQAARSIASQISESWLVLYDDTISLLKLIQTRLLLHLVFFGVLVGLFFRLRSVSRTVGKIELTPAEQFVLDRKFSSALLLTLCWVPVLYSDASPRVLRLVVLLALIPVLVLSPAIVAQRFRSGFYVFLALYLVDFLRHYLPPQWLLARILLLSVAVFGAVSIVALLRQQRREKPVVGPVDNAIYVLLRIGLVLFVGSLVANVVGNVSFAEFMVSPLLRLLFIGVAFRLGAVVAATFVVMALRTPFASLSRMVRERGATAAAHLRRMVNLTAAGLWIYLALFNLGLLTGLAEAYSRSMGREWQVGAAVLSVRDLVSFVLVFSAAYVVSRILRLVLTQEIFPRIRLPRGIPDALELLARYGVLLFGFILALASAGVNLSQVTLALSALGVGVGFGLQNVVNNFVSGLILVFEHPIQVGDLVEVGSHYGRVQQIGFRASVVRRRDGAEVIIPNGELIGTKVLNWSLSDQLRRLDVPVPGPIGTDADRVIDILETVARSCPQVVADPPPRAVLEQFGESSLKFQLRCWVYGENVFPARDQLSLAINKAFEEAGIQIPFPQADVHVHYPDEQVVRAPPAESRKAGMREEHVV